MNDWTILCLVVLIVSVCIHTRLGFVFPFASFRPPSLHFVTKKKIGGRDGELLCPGSAALPPSDCDRRSSLFFMFARGTSVGTLTKVPAWRRSGRGARTDGHWLGVFFLLVASFALQPIKLKWVHSDGRARDEGCSSMVGGWLVGWLLDGRWQTINLLQGDCSFRRVMVHWRRPNSEVFFYWEI